MNYAELFCQSNFSFLEGASHPQELVSQASVLGYEALAITDECSVAGVVRAYTTIKQEQLPIKLIVGSLFRLDDQLEVVLLCPNRQAYAELCRVITNARRRSEKGTYQLAEWDINSLRHCLLIWLPTGQQDADDYWAKRLIQYHKTRVWMGCRRLLRNNEHRHLAYCEKLSQQHRIPITACGGVLMHCAERLPLQQVLTATRLGTSVAQAGRQLLPNAENSLRSLSKLHKLFKPEWLAETLGIADQCHFNLAELRYEYPAELVPEEETPFSYLRQLVAQGIEKRFPEGISPTVMATIEKELTLIEELGYAHFFLTIHDLVQFAQRNNILYQGRGSAANSVVCYCLEITAVDPRHINVLFERFLSKERDEPPDIDVDFEHQRREEVIQYIYEKYGRERAAIAATVICYRFKSALRDVGKALGINESQLDFFIRNINRRDRDTSWESQIQELGFDPHSATGLQFINLVNDIRGFPRHLSQHVGGFVISSGPLYELVPVENASMADRTVIQWDKDDIESLGLLKVDVLALGMLTAIRKSFDLLRSHYGKEYTLAGVTSAMDDVDVYRMIQRADTVGLFQIESRAQMSMLPRLKPACYYDLVIQIAIVRPGPIQGGMVHPYLKRRNGEEAVEYPSEAVKSVLSRTLGVPIFQEQVIQLAMVAAGFSGGEADQLRRAMAAWKKTGELGKFRHKLIHGMETRGYSTEYAQRIYDQICGFGEYGFPESHSASFALLAYASAWLKCHYPVVYYTALLNSLPMGFYSPSQLIQDARRHQVEVRPVCINHSHWDHTLEPEHNGFALRMGFRLVKGLSAEGADKLLAARPNRSGQQFCQASDVKRLGLRKSDLEALASADAFHTLGEDRYHTRWQLMDSEAELPLFAQASLDFVAEGPAPFIKSPSEANNLVEDYASVGLTLNRHPIELLEETGALGRYTHAAELKNLRHKSLVAVAGVVTGRQSPGTAAGVTFITLEDHTGNSNIVVWLATARAQQRSYLRATILKVHGILEREGDVIHIIAGRLTDLSPELNDLVARSRDFQ
ncbi:error-prone DNA polymerase [Marinimicrobium sp. ABcell2]|uniref:error-prone DNA polymerase n=1 Tax=Marinimicrobium sp. ABcell2 TaxID=3069751 RepID=UPI0027B76098|nr:error-prone DNA polymerase [Marinimicrobium sp. ABcell2]MDQ2077763.1 error-prone DNA polymerase [Marinimicrobium sp. ABcell2]